MKHQICTVRNQIRLPDFAEIFERQHLPTLSPGARQQQESLPRIHVLPALGQHRLCDLDDRMEMQTPLNAKAVERLAWWTRKGIKAVLSSMFGRATDWNYWDKRNPVTRVRIGRKQTKYEKRILTDEQFFSLPSGFRNRPARLLRLRSRRGCGSPGSSDCAGGAWILSEVLCTSRSATIAANWPRRKPSVRSAC